MSRKVILIEGPDCSGKTTLTKNIPHDHYIHLSKNTYTIDDMTFPSNNIEDSFKSVIYKLDFMKGTVLVDRGVLSNKVYSSVFKDTDPIRDDLVNEFWKLIDCTIVCVPNRDKYLDKFNEIRQQRDELYTDVDMMMRVLDEYALSLKSNIIKSKSVVVYDMFNVPMDNLSNYINSLNLNK